MSKSTYFESGPKHGAASLVELFSSIQGEGLVVGLRQIFLRFHQCNLICDYCDTVLPDAPQACLLEKKPGIRSFTEVANPVSLDSITEHVASWCRDYPGMHHSMSLTGGEPLLHHRILVDWLPSLAPLIPLYLETNGVLAEELADIVSHLSIIGMDMKLPSTANCGDLWERHRLFLEIAAKTKVFVKIVADDSTTREEVGTAASIIAGVDESIPLVIQPRTQKDGSLGLSPPHMLMLQEVAASRLKEVRIIPQTHKYLGLL
jgi:organic radical activating enzyme